MRKSNICVLVTVFALSATTAFAQAKSTRSNALTGEGQIFGAISFGGQSPGRTFDATLSGPVYGQTATVATSTGVDGGPIFDLNGGYRFINYKGFVKNIGVGLGFSRFGDTGTTLGTASVPSPLFFNRPATVDVPGVATKRSERSVYIQAVWFYPVTDKIEVDVFGGPSFIHASQELITEFTVPAGTQSLNTSVHKESNNTVGGIIGADASYFFTDKLAAGAFARFNGGSVDLDTAKNVKVGGFQMGVGLRIRY